MDELDEENAEVEIVNNYFNVAFKASKLIKKFDIHDGLTFKYKLSLHGRMSEESLMELLDSGSSEEEETGEDEVSENEDSEEQNGEGKSEKEDGEKDESKKSPENEGNASD